jgi:predicted nucleic acid-binding protein
MTYLVDTDVLIVVAKNNPGSIDYMKGLPEAWSVSIITALELLVGARDKKEVGKIDRFLAAVSKVPLTPAVGTTAYNLLKQFSRSHGLRIFDSLIAATAIEEGRTLVTRNEKHFRCFHGRRPDKHTAAK